MALFGRCCCVRKAMDTNLPLRYAEDDVISTSKTVSSLLRASGLASAGALVTFPVTCQWTFGSLRVA